MENLLYSWEKLLKERLRRNLTSPEEAKILYWIVEITLARMLEAGEKIQPKLPTLAKMIERAYESSDFEIEDAALEELELLLKRFDANEPKFKVPTEFVVSSSKNLGEDIINDGSYLALRDPFDASILRIGQSPASRESEKPEEFFTREKSVFQRISESIYDKMVTLFKILFFSRCPDTVSAYLNAGRMYRNSNECMLHFARTPGILDPNDYKEWHRKMLFRSIIRSRAPVIYYVCNFSTTLEDLKSRIDLNEPQSVVDSLSDYLVPFIDRRGLEIVLAEVPRSIFNESGNVSVVSNTDILYSRRRKTRIECGYRISTTLIRKTVREIPVLRILNFEPKEVFSWIELLPHYLPLAEMSDAEDLRTRAKEIAQELVSLAGAHDTTVTSHQ